MHVAKHKARYGGHVYQLTLWPYTAISNFLYLTKNEFSCYGNDIMTQVGIGTVVYTTNSNICLAFNLDHTQKVVNVSDAHISFTARSNNYHKA